MWTGLNWLRIESGGELLWKRWWTFGFHWRGGIFFFWLPEWLL